MSQNIYTEEELYWSRGGKTGMLPERITPSQVNVLADGEIFVFGSNFQGRHIGGAAKVAKEKYGAVWGIGEGLQGKSYAIPTMEGLENLAPAVQRFTSFAKQHKELKFFVTAIGCGIAGYQAEEIAPFFLNAAYLPNVYLPLSFWKIIIHIPGAEDSIRNFAQAVLDVCRYAHHNNPPTWNTTTDEVLFNSLERDQHWQLGLLLGVISPTEEEPQIKALPKELRQKILEALKQVC